MYLCSEYVINLFINTLNFNIKMKIYSTPSTTVMNAEVENAILVGSVVYGGGGTVGYSWVTSSEFPGIGRYTDPNGNVGYFNIIHNDWLNRDELDFANPLSGYSF